MKKLSLVALLALGTLGSVSIIQANELEVSGNVGATSNYIWRGMTQTKDKSSVNGGADLKYNGFYAGTWASNVDFGTEANFELDAYIGYSNIINDFSYDFSYTKIMYPDSHDESDFDEAKLTLGYLIGDLTLGTSYLQTVYQEWGGHKPSYAEATASYDFKILSLDTSYGDYEDIGTNYTVGVSKSVKIEEQAIKLALVYASFNSDASNDKDEKNLFVTAKYSF
ncbi:MAG: TorF family putative porin [Aliarcobacter sp.]|nr:TorF family putative porin [Aliarcobacter sp.]